ncbi:DEAD/DEAH box helicase [Salinispora cortesiana]|uniref:DEAD/DEAH box helicase n=1 Tax=Salinispora cortesiana TaxID=1305843 RepID=UPI00040AD53F|nr:DEAD/DEAH box helicase [Salinispora cortesiana]
MVDTGTVEQLVLARWSVRLAAVGRFATPGWSYEEPVARPCPACQGRLHSLRKPYESRGRRFRYVALVCPRCPALFTLADLGLKTYEQVRKVAPTPPPPTAATGGPNALDGAAASAAARRTPVSVEAQRRRDILRFWRSVELFAAQTLDRPDPRERRYAPRPGQALPWQEGHSLRRQRVSADRVWRHTVYGGVFSLDRVHAVAQEVFGSSPADVDERTPRGETALFAVAVTDDGRLLLDSLVLSTAAWAVGRATVPGPAAPNWLDGFDLSARVHGDRVREMVAAADDDHEAAELAEEGVAVSRPVTPVLLQALVELTADHLGVTRPLGPAGVRVHSELVSRRRAHEAQSDFLNSFFAEDLQRVAEAVAEGNCGAALASYLSSDETITGLPRWDVRESARSPAPLDELAPERVPAGRWPARPAHSLATSQQLAINVIHDRFVGKAGAFAVNGPPGTGKTTMLRDLIAALIVERARRLATLRTPTAAFADQTLGWRSDKHQRRVRALRPELVGFEIVVASANNGALSNVTREIPQTTAIDESWAEQASYLREHAERVLGAPAWGMIAGMLGNKRNRREFIGRLWYGDPADPDKDPGDEGPGLHEWLKDAEVEGQRPWQHAVKAFTNALAAERQLREARQRIHTALRLLPELQRTHTAAVGNHQVAVAVRQRAEKADDAAAAAAAAAQQTADAALWRRREHRGLKPGFWDSLFTFGKASRRWYDEDETLAVALDTAEQSVTVAATAVGHTRRAKTAATDHEAAAAEALRRAAGQLADGRRALDDWSRKHADTVPDEAWLADKRRRELVAPWLDEEWNSARTRVFLAALDLHEAFLASTAKIMRANLTAAVDVLSGQVPPDAPEPAVRAAWQSLFLTVPVISTTFASVGRLLRPLGSEALGWLLVDEAGQAAPQIAVGAIWRTRRLVAVGDPLQLEPVVTVLHTTQQALRRHHQVAETWLPGRGSVQTLTDRLTPIGTHLPGPDDTEVWVGAPLTVHRRCDNPMFEVVNEAVYDQLMTHATSPRQDPMTVADSAWIDVTSADADGHWIPAEGDATEQIINYLLRVNVAPAQIMVISPFRDVARRLRRRWQPVHPGMTCGTVHTAQGKEADVVLFVLGGNPTRPGARSWAASQPNLFNVAVSRAKQRLYVIGNHDSWAKLPYFGALARKLPVRPLRTDQPSAPRPAADEPS